jgi:ketosteroid isomerase-like protein
MARSAFEVIGSFVAAINARDISAMRSLMTEDHTFIDARGTRYYGADLNIDNWKNFFVAFPQYWISITSSFAYNDRVGLFGEAGGKWRVDGTVIPGSWKVTAGWLAEIENGKVSRWEIFCDTAWATPPTQKEAPLLSIVEV